MANPVLVGKTSQAAWPIVSAAGATAASGSSFHVQIACDATSAVTSVTDNKGNTYTQNGSAVSSGGAQLVEYRCIAGTGGAGHTVTVNGTGTPAGTVYLVEIPGAGAGAYDSASRATASQAAASTASVTSNAFAQASTTIIAAAVSSSGTNPNTWTNNTFTSLGTEVDGSQFWTSALSYKVVSATTAQNASWTALSIVNQTIVGYSLIVPPAVFVLYPHAILRPKRTFKGGKMLGVDIREWW